MASIISNRIKAPDMFVGSLSLPSAPHHSLHIDAKLRRVTGIHTEASRKNASKKSHFDILVKIFLLPGCASHKG
jgi:hypothetical protein